MTARWNDFPTQGALVDRPAVACGQGAEARKAARALRDALVHGDVRQALREARRLGTVGGDRRMDGLRAGFDVLVRDAVERAPWGFDTGLALLSELYAWTDAGAVPAAEAFVTAAAAVCEPRLNLTPRPVSVACADTPDDANTLCADLVAGRRAEAESRVRRWTRAHGARAAVTGLLLPALAVSRAGPGEGPVMIARAEALAGWCPALAEDIMASAVVALSWFTHTPAPTDSTWCDALACLDGLRGGDRLLGTSGCAHYEAAVLAGAASAVDATVNALGEGIAPRELLRACGHAAAVRLVRFDPRWESRPDTDVTVLDVTRGVTLVDAAVALTAGDGAAHAAHAAVLCASMVGSMAWLDGPAHTAVTPRSGSLVHAAADRDPADAMAIVLGMSPGARRAGFVDLCPFVAFDAAVRPVFYAHAVTTAAALARLNAADSQADAAYLSALVACTVPRRTERFVRRTVALAAAPESMQHPAVLA